MGPTRDLNLDERCHECLKDSLRLTGESIGELQRELKRMAEHRADSVQKEEQLSELLKDARECRDYYKAKYHSLEGFHE